jgi:PilZ domain
MQGRFRGKEENVVGDDHAQQRRPARLPFAAELLATELNSGSEIWGETTNLSKGGCYVRTSQSFPRGTLLLIEIRNHGKRFQTDARVAYALEHEGMGLSFFNIPGNQLPILEDWLSSAMGKQPMQASRGEAE